MAMKYARRSLHTTVPVVVGNPGDVVTIDGQDKVVNTGLVFGGRKRHKLIRVFTGNRDARRNFFAQCKACGVFWERAEQHANKRGEETWGQTTAFEVIGTEAGLTLLETVAELTGMVSRGGAAVEDIVAVRVVHGSGAGEKPRIRREPDAYYKPAPEMRGDAAPQVLPTGQQIIRTDDTARPFQRKPVVVKAGTLTVR